jgi:hypothetical protein
MLTAFSFSFKVYVSFWNKSLLSFYSLDLVVCSVLTQPYAKFLGVYLDEQLTWGKHIEEICKKLRRVCGVVSRNRYIFPFRIKSNLYYSLFNSTVTYCLLAYGTAAASHTDKILTLQKNFIRVMYNLDFNATTQQYFLQSKILKFKSRVFRICKIFGTRRFEHQKRFLTDFGRLSERVYLYLGPKPSVRKCSDRS